MTTDSSKATASLLPCPFCGGAMMFRAALWPSEGDTDAVIHAEPTTCPMSDFSDGTADGSILEKWNRRAAAPAFDAMKEALEAAGALATCCMATDCYSRDEIANMARATRDTFSAALRLASGEEQ